MTSPREPAAFDRFAGDYDRQLGRGLEVSGEDKLFFARGRIDWLGRRLAARSYTAQRVLDYGCGTGTSVPLLLALPGVREAAGTDLSNESLEVARRDCAGLAASFQPLTAPARAGAFDLAFCNGVFHHIPPAERPAAFDYIRRSLRPGGLFAFWENNPWNPGTRYVMSRIEFDRDAITITPRESRDLLRAAGFEVLGQDFLFFFPRALRWFRRFEPALCRCPFGAQYLTLAQRPTGP